MILAATDSLTTHTQKDKNKSFTHLAASRSRPEMARKTAAPEKSVLFPRSSATCPPGYLLLIFYVKGRGVFVS